MAGPGLVKGVGVDAEVLGRDPRVEANAALRAIARRADAAGRQAMLKGLARASGVTPTADQLRQFDRVGKRVSNADWASPTDPEARITRLKDGRTVDRGAGAPTDRPQARACGRSRHRRDPRRP